jgi:hypothetical protein
MTTDLNERQHLPMTDHSRPPNRWTRPGFIAATGVIALIATAALAFVAFPPHHAPAPDTTAPIPASPARTAAATIAKATGSDSVCGLPAGGQTIPTTPAANTRWELVGTTAAPTAPTTFGPGSKTGLRSCFAHSPTGALYALVNYIAEADDPASDPTAFGGLVVKGPSRTEAIGQKTANKAQLGDPNTRIQVAGFAYLNYATTDAVIDIALRVTTAPGQMGYVHVPQTMHWEDGDWKSAPGPDGQIYDKTKPLSDLDGYVIWSGA